MRMELKRQEMQWFEILRGWGLPSIYVKSQIRLFYVILWALRSIIFSAVILGNRIWDFKLYCMVPFCEEMVPASAHHFISCTNKRIVIIDARCDSVDASQTNSADTNYCYCDYYYFRYEVHGTWYMFPVLNNNTTTTTTQVSASCPSWDYS